MVLFCFVPFCANAQKDGKQMSINVSSVKVTPRADTLKVDFKLMKEGKKIFLPNLLKRDAKEAFTIAEEGSSEGNQPWIESLVDIREQKSMAENLSILLLIDRSSTVSDALLWAQGQMVGSIVKALPDTRLYIAYMMDGKVTRTERLDTLSYANSHLTNFYKGSQSGEKNLYRSILSKLQELSGEEQTYYGDVASLPDFKDDKGEKVMFVFTDGKIQNAQGEYYGGDYDYSLCRNEYFKREADIRNDLRENIPIHCVYVGDTAALNETLAIDLEALCSTGKDEEMKGKFYQTLTPDSLQGLMMGTLDSLAADYRLVLVNPEGKVYDGSRLTLMLTLNGEGGSVMAQGGKDYGYASKTGPATSSYKDKSGWNTILIGLLLGLLLISLTYAILQYVVPFFGYKQFLKKYVVTYSKVKKADAVDQKCFYCKGSFENDDVIVVKCDHWVHKECWDENHNRCPEYGRHKCTKGIHYYNQEKKSDPKNATHYLQWILGGFLAGLASWLGFKALDAGGVFVGLMETITTALYPFEGEADLAVVAAMATKTAGWLQGGACLGFFLVLAFSYVLEFRKIDAKVVGMLLLRSFVGAVIGCAAFMLGTLIVILCGKEYSCWWIDWIPWLFFALATSVVVWYKTEIELKSALIGGAVSVLFSFIVMFVLTGEITSMFSYMIYGAGLGCAIAVVHFASEKYFLRIDGCIKEREIAIYKWMSVTGGFNRVSIGKSPKCVLQMNWDSTEDISDRAVELYLENDRPYCQVLDAGVTQQGRTIPKGTKLLLTQGSEFSIGKTRFTYIEKDK